MLWNKINVRCPDGGNCRRPDRQRSNKKAFISAAAASVQKNETAEKTVARPKSFDLGAMG